jgi:hypothetical protein
MSDLVAATGRQAAAFPDRIGLDHSNEAVLWACSRARQRFRLDRGAERSTL